MADGGGFYSPRFNNPNLPNLKNNWADFNTRNNVSQTREPRSSGSMSKRLDNSDEFRGKSDVFRHQLDMSRLDGGRGNHFQSGQANINEGYNNRSVNFSCDMSQGYSTQRNPSYLNSTSSFASHGQDMTQEHRQRVPNFNNSLQIPPSQNMPPFVGMMSPGTGNPMHPNSFPDAPSNYVQNQMFSDNRQYRDTGIPYPPPMYDTQGNICMPPPPMLPPSLPQNNQASYGGHPGLMQTQSGMIFPPNQIQELKEQDIISKSEDQEWVNRFAEERGYIDKDMKNRPKIKVCRAY